MKKIVFILFVLYSMTSCHKLVQDDFCEFPTRPVVNAVFCADSLLRMQISLTGNVNAEQHSLVDDATVNLFRDGVLLEQLSYEGNGFYRSADTIRAGHRYRCEVDVPTFSLVVCSDSVPFPMQFVDVTHINEAGIDDDMHSYPAVEVTFTNEAQKKCYYEVVINLLVHGSVKSPELINIVDPVLVNEGVPIAVFSNELIDGNTYTMSINYATGSGYSNGDNVYHTMLYPLILELRSVSYDYYCYAKQFYLYWQGRYPNGFGGTPDVFNLYSNVQNGYGIFAAYSSVKTDTIMVSPELFNVK